MDMEDNSLREKCRMEETAVGTFESRRVVPDIQSSRYLSLDFDIFRYPVKGLPDIRNSARYMANIGT